MQKNIIAYITLVGACLSTQLIHSSPPQPTPEIRNCFHQQVALLKEGKKLVRWMHTLKQQMLEKFETLNQAWKIENDETKRKTLSNQMETLLSDFEREKIIKRAQFRAFRKGITELDAFGQRIRQNENDQ